MANLRQELYAWRDQEAARRGVELFRVLPNSALDEIVRALPRAKEEMIAIKGIKEAKFREYGEAILRMIEGQNHLATWSPSDLESSTGLTAPQPDEQPVFSVSSYLDIVNRELSRLHARVHGEVTSFKFQGNALYMGIKDPKDESVLSVFMWSADFSVAGIELAQGLEVIVEGGSEIYKPSGRFNFRAHTIELVGEGALQKAYAQLKKKLEAEGLFALERKKPLPEYPEKIGLITSKTGAVIHDFCNNLGKHGYHISFFNSRVEGAAAVKDLLAAIRHFKTQSIDVLVLVRGGGSLESLQAFNNEHVVHAIAEFPIPTIVAIGHDKDVPLAQLVADLAPSTPSICAGILNASWIEAVHIVRNFTKDIFALCREELWNRKDELGRAEQFLKRTFAEISQQFEKLCGVISGAFAMFEKRLAVEGETLGNLGERVFRAWAQLVKDEGAELTQISRMLTQHNPLRQLKLGYSILSRGGKIIRHARDVEEGEHFEARLSDGTLDAQVLRADTRRFNADEPKN